jgi:hypothetical protein
MINVDPEAVHSSGLSFNVPESWGHVPPRTSIMVDLRAFAESYKLSGCTRRKRTRLRKQRNRSLRHIRWLLSRARRGHGQTFEAKLRVGEYLHATLALLRPR